MSPEDVRSRLSQIQTAWSLVFQAHQGEQAPALAAQQQLLLRYHGAVYRYLLGALRDPDAADEVAQELAVRFLQGKFKAADPRRGRFRDLVKVALRHLMIDYWRQKNKAPRTGEGSLEVGTAPSADELDGPFLVYWREELLERAWEALEAEEARTGQPCHTVLRWKTEQPKARSAELAGRLGALKGRPFSENALRKVLFRARARFAELLVEEVARSLGASEPDRLEEELIELGLLDYCSAALEGRRARPS
jgi:RNA polymerase sigma-70 factor (ECF subfamily)